jgi:pimeloyl-ACP methyl ester carboxylesterase
MIDFITVSNKEGLMFDGIHAHSENNKKVIIDIHGLSWDFYTTNFYRQFYKYLPEQGIDFISGETSGAHKLKNYNKTDHTYELKGGALEIFEDCVDDIKTWINKAEELGYKEIYLSGYSYGPTKTTYYYTKTKDKRIKGLIFISPSDIYGLVHEPTEAERHERNVLEAKDLVKSRKGEQFLKERLWGLELFSAKTYLSLFDNPNAFIFNFFKPELGFETVNKINIPVLAFTGTEDYGIKAGSDPSKAMKILEKELINCPKKKTKIFSGAEHSFDGFANEMIKEIVRFVK